MEQWSALRIQTLFRGYRVRKRTVWQIREDLRAFMEEMDREFNVSYMVMGYAKPQELMEWKGHESVQFPQIKDVFFRFEYTYPLPEIIASQSESAPMDTTAIEYPVEIEHEPKEKGETFSLTCPSPTTFPIQLSHLNSEDKADMENIEKSSSSPLKMESNEELMEDGTASNEPEAVQELEDVPKKESTFDSAESSEKNVTEELNNHIPVEPQDCDEAADDKSNGEHPMIVHESIQDLSGPTLNTLVEPPSPATTINAELMIQSDESLIEQITLTHTGAEIQQELAWARQALADRLEYLWTRQHKQR